MFDMERNYKFMRKFLYIIEKTDNLSTASSVFSNGSNLSTGRIINGLIHIDIPVDYSGRPKYFLKTILFFRI